ncbi:MAG: hypothetical protein AAFX06_28525 [Planctomycetota bacterium]
MVSTSFHPTRLLLNIVALIATWISIFFLGKRWNRFSIRFLLGAAALASIAIVVGNLIFQVVGFYGMYWYMLFLYFLPVIIAILVAVKSRIARDAISGTPLETNVPH